MTSILLIYTGGTIGMVRDYKTKSLKPFNFDNVLERLPELKLLDVKIDTIAFDTVIDSSDMQVKHWQTLATMIETNYKKYDGFVVLHGTDTMSYTASAISFMFSGLKKPIIFTGSQLPIGDLRTDAKENLISSIHFAAYQEQGVPKIQEVCVYFEYKLYRANRTTKMSASHFDAFSSPNYPCIGESGVELELNEALLFKDERPFLCKLNLSEKVGLLKIFPGINKTYLYNVLQMEELEALIIEAYGSGNIFSDKKFNKIITKRVKEGLKVVIITQCLSGGVQLGKYKSSSLLLEIGAVSGKDITTEAAVTKAMYLLGDKKLKQEFNRYFTANLRGEMK